MFALGGRQAQALARLSTHLKSRISHVNFGVGPFER